MNQKDSIVRTMSSQSNTSVIAVVIAGVIVVAGFVGFGYVTTSSSLVSLSKQNTSLSQQLAGVNAQDSNLNQQVSNQNQQISGLNQQLSSASQQLSGLSQLVSNQNQLISGLSQLASSGNQQLSSLSQQVSTLEQRTQTVVTVSNTVVTVETTTSLITTTLTSVTAVPAATLVIIGDSYDNASVTFTFQVQNTQNYTVYAQVSASLWGQGYFGCSGQAGTFVSQIYTFEPGVVTTTQLNLALGSYAGFCGANPVSSLNLNLVVPQSVPVSPTYTFTIVPNYYHT